MPKNLDQKDVRYVANLAHIGLSENELEKFQSQLSSILEFVSKLEKVKTDKIAPLNQTTGLKNVFREDEIAPSLSQEQVLKNSPGSHNGYFKTKPVFK
ncbi:MAG: Asp-tRNA(Asn)/Glu-tRNA(Gln) amidotransferase subunit GatC [bacterium]|nr:Asp-tRNA(Asn)/Glu-tRNA(Gln) amidotransferase subunit GatC [bacterium]